MDPLKKEIAASKGNGGGVEIHIAHNAILVSASILGAAWIMSGAESYVECEGDVQAPTIKQQNICDKKVQAYEDATGGDFGVLWVKPSAPVYPEID